MSWVIDQCVDGRYFSCTQNSIKMEHYPDQTCATEPFDSMELKVAKCSAMNNDFGATYLESIICPIMDQHRWNWLCIGMSSAIALVLLLVIVAIVWRKRKLSYYRTRDMGTIESGEVDELSNLSTLLNK